MRSFSFFYLTKHMGKKAKSIFYAAIYSLLSCAYAYSVESENTRFELMLAGGGLATCSSMATKNCVENHFGDGDKSEIHYQISAKNTHKFNNSAVFLALPNEQKAQINLVIKNIYAKSAGVIVNAKGLRELFAQSGNLPLYKNMEDALYYALLDSFEYAQIDSKGLRKQERVDLTQNKNQASVRIYQRFVQQARLRMPEDQSVPKIAVITASSRDPFEVADFYLSVFEQAGAEVMWLPLDKTYQQARQREMLGETACDILAQVRAANNSYYREEIYPLLTSKQRQFCHSPELMLHALSEVQGVFFNGGDQSLTLAALSLDDGTDSPELTLIKQQVKSGKLIVGGTSAGTAVQPGGVFGQLPVPMISNGDPELAMSRGAFATEPPSQRCSAESDCGQGILGGDLTYKVSGGTGLFDLGLLDTHFSERDRETRLAVFTADTKQRFGFGVDEATALLVAYPPDRTTVTLEIIGQNGVFIVDRASSRFTRETKTDPSSGENVELAALSHYLTDSSLAYFDLENSSWRFLLSGQTLNEQKPLSALGQGQWRDEVRAMCGSKDKIIWQKFANQYQVNPGVNTVFAYDPSLDHCSYSNLPFVITYTN